MSQYHYSFHHNHEISTIGWSNNGYLLASGGKDGLFIMNDTGRMVVKFDESTKKLEWCPDSDDIIATLSYPVLVADVPHSLKIFDTRSNRLVVQFPTYGSKLSWNVNSLAVCSLNKISLYDMRMFKEVSKKSVPFDIHSVILRSNYLYIGAYHPALKGIVRLMDPMSLTPTKTLSGAQGSVFTMAWGNNMLATGSEDGYIILWDSKDWLPVRVMELPGTGYPREVAFSPNNKFLTAFDDHGILYNWSLNGKHEAIQVYAPKVTSMAFGKLLAVSYNAYGPMETGSFVRFIHPNSIKRNNMFRQNNNRGNFSR